MPRRKNGNRLARPQIFKLDSYIIEKSFDCEWKRHQFYKMGCVFRALKKSSAEETNAR